MKHKKPKVIAEIGCNHCGEVEIAKRLIDEAKFCGAWSAKFQKRCPVELLPQDQYNSPHPVPHNSYGSTYGEHREFLEFDIKTHKQLQQYCEEKKIVYSASVWDKTSAKQIALLNPQYIKVGSPSNTNFDIYRILFEQYDKEIHVSMGMTTRKEEEQIFNFFYTNNKIDKLIIYCCTSDYPVKHEDVCLLEIQRLKQYGCKIGFSGHHLGIAVDIAAMMLEVDYIERHFTLDRTMKGTDHPASLEPQGLRKLVRDIEAVSKAITEKQKEILDCETAQRQKLKFKNLSQKEDVA